MNSHENSSRYWEKQFDFELKFKYNESINFLNDYWTSVVYITLFYVLFIYFLQFLMKNREKFDLRRELFWWNLFLAVFSWCGTIRMVPEIGDVIRKFGIQHSVCVNWFEGNQVTLFWSHMFILSKVLELGDTLFIVLRKQPLKFLHIYHHSTVLICTWYGCSLQASISRWFIIINFAVHSLMYSYFTLKSFHVKIPLWVSMCLTSVQIAQMVFAGGITVYAYRVKSSGAFCNISQWDFTLAFFFYFSYFVLFLNFFYMNYINERRVKKESNKEKLNADHLRISVNFGKKKVKSL